MKPEISIVIPAYEEEARVGDSIAKILSYLMDQQARGELIVVDDGSEDSTALTAEQAFRAFPEVPSGVIRYEKNRGKGFAVKTGLLAAKADIALFTDADLSTPIEEMSQACRSDPERRIRCDLRITSPRPQPDRHSPTVATRAGR